MNRDITGSRHALEALDTPDHCRAPAAMGVNRRGSYCVKIQEEIALVPAVSIVSMPRRQLPVNGARSRSHAVRAACVALSAVFAGGCATTTDLGRTERLPEGTLPPSKEVGPPVNIQPAPLARDEYRGAPRHPWASGPAYGPGWYGPRCFDPVFCGPRARPGFGLHYRMF
jgi:hypothetical protein